jgi:signal transduction histidine kinase
MEGLCLESTSRAPHGLIEDLVNRFQSASQSLEKSYAELQERVRILTKQLQKERDERIRLERLAAMGEMAMELAHEIRNPLGSIELYASMSQGEYAEQIVRSVRLLNHTVSNVLQFGTPIRPVPQEISFAHLFDGIRALLEPMASRKQIRLEVHCNAGCVGFADHELLHRMLLNLVLNALRETPAQGTIRLTAVKDGNDISISVADNGPGISVEKQDRIFDPMFSTSREGCGLGLPIVKRIVESHNGTVTLKSSTEGTTFHIFLRNAAWIGGHVCNTEVTSEPATCS